MSLYENINKRKKAGTSRSKKNSTISKESYNNMKAGFPKSDARERVQSYREGGKVQKKSPAWQRAEGKSKSGGLNKKGIASYRKDNPGSKLSMAVTTKPSKLKKGSKSAKRRKSFCARMKGMRKRQKSSNNTGKDRLSLSLKKWNC